MQAPVPSVPTLPEAPEASKSKPAASRKRIEKLFSTGDTLPVIEREITGIGYPAISEDRIAVWISAGVKKHLISREGDNPWQSLFSTGDTLPGIKGEIADIGYPAISEDRIAVRIDADGKGHLISREGDNPWQSLFSTGDTFPVIEGRIAGIGDPAISEDSIAVWISEVSWINAGGNEHLIYRKGNNPWQRLFSTGDTLLVIEGKILGIGYPAISEDRITVRISAGGGKHLIYRKGNNPWQRLFSAGDTLPVIEGKILGIGNPAISEDSIAVWIDAGDKSNLIYREGNNPWQRLFSAGDPSLQLKEKLQTLVILLSLKIE